MWWEQAFCATLGTPWKSHDQTRNTFFVHSLFLSHISTKRSSAIIPTSPWRSHADWICPNEVIGLPVPRFCVREVQENSGSAFRDTTNSEEGNRFWVGLASLGSHSKIRKETASEHTDNKQPQSGERQFLNWYGATIREAITAPPVATVTAAMQSTYRKEATGVVYSTGTYPASMLVVKSYATLNVESTIYHI